MCWWLWCVCVCVCGSGDDMLYAVPGVCGCCVVCVCGSGDHMLYAVPGVGVDVLVVVEACPTGLLVEWCLVNPDLLGGPVAEVQYVLVYTPAADIQYLDYSPALTVSPSLPPHIRIAHSFTWCRAMWWKAWLLTLCTMLRWP